ncbi:LuxR C-terminal-related transcriptional regulator [Paractinoplanes globisporus]|uniref:LuxR C-terminal-related transcriptional regulator n=1 Tax=Paractinoplanes globisporus TaxID=113565 RepID=A0ABW6W3M7_9ACTN|nr:LuxR C-terminal-related transcriptional regulator [Actinoplanes globisporus]
MAELSDSRSRHALADTQSGLLATKLYVPRLPPGFVTRPRLVGLLEGGLARELVLVCAPAGFGKTSLLADLCRRSPRPVGWLSLDAGDNDPARFWRHLAAAVEQVRPGIAERAEPLLSGPAPGSFERVATGLINELAAEPHDVVLVLDDYHLIDAPPVHASLEFLLRHQPPGLHVVMASRTDPPLPLARWRARGRLAELRADVLRFTGEEAADLLRGAVGPDLNAGLGDDAVAALATRTEGWAAGLQLAALSLLGTPDVASFVATFSGSHRYVLDYLTEEVLTNQPEPVREFLLETSVLERLSGPLCDAVTGRVDGQAMLEAIERANLFLSPLDDVRGWWRYHQLFADLLRARLQQQRPERQRELHRSAAAWHEAHGSVDEAVRHALAAGDATWAARLLERHFDELQMRSEVATVRRWFAALPAELIAARPRLLLMQAHYAFLAGRLDEGEGLLEAAERAWPPVADEPYEPSVARAASLLVNVPAWIAVEHAFIAYSRGDAEQTARFATRALAGAGEDEWMLDTVARGHLTMATWLRGRVDEAERELISQVATLRTLDKRDETAWVCGLLGQVQSARGDLDAAAATYRQAVEMTAPPGRAAPPAAGVGYAGLAEVAYQRNDLDAASRHLAAALPLCRQLVYTPSLARALATLAWIRHAQGDEAGSREAADEAVAAAPGPDLVDLFNPVPAQRARLLLAQGDVDAAARWTAGRGVDADDEPRYPREPAYLVLARVLLAQGRTGQALRLLDRLRSAATVQNRIGSVIEIQALRALALAADSRRAEALAALTDAVGLAQPQGYIRVFADEGPPMAALLGRLPVNDTVPMAYVGRLMRAFRHADAEAAAVPGLVAGLSGRELEVLRLMAAGKQNKEIADQLYVTVDTVKKHVTHILEKLGASNRTEATARARELSLLP